MCPRALEHIGLDLVPDNTETLAQIGVGLRRAANLQLQMRHTGPALLATVDAVESHEPGQRQPDGPEHVRNVTTFGERTTDRSPCGTGTCARVAVLHATGDLALGQHFVSGSIIGTCFVGQIAGETRVGGFRATIPEVTGRAHVTGFHQFVLDPDDPFPNGFSLMEPKLVGGWW